MLLFYTLASELQEAEVILFARSQRCCFSKELQKVSAGKPLKLSSLLVCVTPTIGSGGLFRVGGRLTHSSLSYSQQHPVILHGRDPMTKLYVHSQHRLLLHAGPTLLMSTVGTSLYIVGARRLVRTICCHCVICWIQRGK